MAEESDHENERIVIEISESDSDSASISDAARPDLRVQKLYCRYCGQQGHLGKDCSKSEVLAIREDLRRTRVTGRNAAVRLAFQQDNAGFALWRAKKSACSTFDFPRGFEHATDIHGEHSRPLRISHFTKTYIEMERMGRNGKYKANIWAAEAEQNDAARKMLQEWRDEVVPNGTRAAETLAPWNKTKNTVPSRARADALAHKRKFTKDFADTDLFAKFYRVDWQLEADNLDPQAVLGYQLEGLDGIRMDHEVYIKLIGQAFGVLGVNDLEARKACIRLQNIQYNALANDCLSYQFYLVKPVPYADLRRTIIYQDYAEPRLLNSISDALPMSDAKAMIFGPEAMDTVAWTTWNQTFAETITQNEMSLGGTSVTIPNVTNKLNALYIELWFQKMMQYQPYHLGHLQMRASIGTCLMTLRMAGDEFDIGSFCEDFDSQNRDQTGMESVFTRELGSAEEEDKLLQRFMDDDAPVELDRMPIDRYQADGSLNMAPHTTSVQFSIANGEDRYELHLAFNNLESIVGISTWIKLDENEVPFMDINMFDLQKPHLSYNLHASWKNVLGNDDLWKLPSFWTRFADLIRIKADAIRDPNNRQHAFDFPEGSSGSLPITDFVQQQVWRFHVKDSPYIVELQRRQKFDCHMDAFGLVHASPYEPRCGIQLYHPLWDSHLAENASLKLGYRASWTPAEHEFFPVRRGEQESAVPGSVWVRGSGIREWLRVMGVVEKIVAGGYAAGEEVQRPDKDAQQQKQKEREDEQARQLAEQVGELIMA